MDTRMHKTRSSRERGASLIEIAFMLPLLTLILLGVIDFGRGCYMAIEVSNAARAGAMYGYQNAGAMKDAAGIQAAATADAPDVSGMTATSTYGCMCSDGTSQNPTCSAPPTCSGGTRKVNYVTVTTAATYKPLFPWPSVGGWAGIPASFNLNGQSTLLAGD